MHSEVRKANGGTWVKYTEQNSLFLQMKNALKKFFGQQSILLHSCKTQHSSKNPEEQDVNVALPQRYTLQNQ